WVATGDVAGSNPKDGGDSDAGHRKHHGGHNGQRGAERRELDSDRNSRVCTPAEVTHDRAPPFVGPPRRLPKVAPWCARSRVGASCPLPQPSPTPSA